MLSSCVLTYDLRRYTDFLVNEILPSGTVVHLDSLKRPSGGVQVNQTNTAEVTPSKLVENTLGLSSVPAQATATSEKNEDLEPQTVSNLVPEETLSPADEVDGGVMIPKTQVTESSGISENQASATEKKSLELENSEFLRKREKVLLRQTSLGLIEVTDQNEAKLLLAEMEASHSRNKDKISKQDLQTVQKGSLADNESQEEKETPQQRQELKDSSLSEWQAFAQAPKSFQVGPITFHLQYMLIVISLLLTIESCLFPISTSKL